MANKVIGTASDLLTAVKTWVVSLLSNKVDKVSGKGLSTNDFTTTYKNKLDGITENATPNTIDTVKVNGTALVPDASKAVNVTLSGLGGIPSTEKGSNNGVATLGSDGKIPSSQLPSYVDDVLEYANLSSFPTTGEAGKIYVALDTNKTYRWGGTSYVVISETISIGTTTGTAFDGKVGNDHVNNSGIHVTSTEKSSWNGKYTKPSTGIPKTDLDSGVQNSLGKADSALQSETSLSKGATTGSGNVVTEVSVNGHTITLTKGITALTQHQDISGKEDKSNKVTTWTSTPTDNHYPSEKLVKGSLDSKYEKPSTGIPKSDLASDVQTSLGKADTALQAHQSLAGYVPTSRKVAGKALTSDITLVVADISDLQFMTPDEMANILNS